MNFSFLLSNIFKIEEVGMLKTITSKRTEKSILNLPLLETNIFNHDDFTQRLLIEKRRAERINSKSIIILFNFEKLLNKADKFETEFLFDQFSYLLKIIATNIRITDAVHAYSRKTVAVLLTDTNSDGAKCACKRLVSELLIEQENYFNSLNLKPDDSDISILDFPEKFDDENWLKMDHNNSLFSSSTGKNQIENMISTYEAENPTTQYPKHPVYATIYAGTAIALPLNFDLFGNGKPVFNLTKYKLKIKRIIDFFGSGLGLLALTPFFTMVGALIKLTSPGPVFFKQERIGYKGKYFIVFKFRTMRHNCNDKLHQEYVKNLINGNNCKINNGSNDDPFFKITKDPRVTQIGRFLRKTSLDELPQLINVFLGNMSLVGPRPPIEYEVKEYKKWHYRRLSLAKPGITGLWQVSGRNRTTFDDMVRLDIQYAENWSLFLDLKILLKTIKVLFDGI